VTPPDVYASGDGNTATRSTVRVLGVLCVCVFMFVLFCAVLCSKCRQVRPDAISLLYCICLYACYQASA
jgi:hypothetical protein